MAFSLKRKESVEQGLRRLAEERIDSALDLLKHHRRPKAVHGARKDIKKVRAMLRLARAQMPKKAYRCQTNLLRKAADRLSGTRDAFVQQAALKNLSRHLPDRAAKRALRPIRDQLATELVVAEKGLKDEATRVTRLLKRVPKEWVEFDHDGWRVIGRGVKSTFAFGRRAYNLAQKEPSVENLHDWRKRAKDLWYQVRILRSICPRELDRLAAQLKELTEYLGDDHDLVILGESPAFQAPAQLELLPAQALREMIEQRRRELQMAAFKAGALLYAQAPEDFCERLHQFWRSWRKGHRSRASGCEKTRPA